MIKIETLFTENFKLRKFEDKDVDLLFQIYSDLESMQYRGYEPFKTKLDAEQFLKEVWLFENKQVSFRWAIVNKATDELIGNFMYKPIDTVSGEIGYSISKADWGKGIIKEIIAYMKLYLSERYGIKTLWAFVLEKNLASIKIMESAHFKMTDINFNFTKFQYSYKYQFHL
jgi:[ribosomal protein S5]-alanine N-acetyltransferase